VGFTLVWRPRIDVILPRRRDAPREGNKEAIILHIARESPSGAQVLHSELP
jgi:hypothetical protein